MRAWQVGAHGEPSEVLRLVEVDEPAPGPGEVRVRVEAAGVGLPDVLLCRGTYAFRPPLPLVPGQEVCGVVDAVGEGVDVVPGSRVMGVTAFTDGRGGFAEATVVAAANAFRVPDAMSRATAAGFRIPYSTAWTALVHRGRLQAGETLVVLGATGSSGQAALLLGRALGARVVAVAAGPEKVGACRSLGADVVVDRDREPVTEAVLETTGGRGADLVFDPVGGPLAGSLVRGLARGGRLLAVGFASGDWVSVPTPELVRRNVSLVGVLAAGGGRSQDEADHEALLALAGDGALDGLVTAVPFDEVPQALDRVAGGSVVGKLVVTVAAP